MLFTVGYRGGVDRVGALAVGLVATQCVASIT